MDETLAELIFCIQILRISFPKGIGFMWHGEAVNWTNGIVYLILFMKDRNVLGFTLKVLVHFKTASYSIIEF
jgi:hypothetical protein